METDSEAGEEASAGEVRDAKGRVAKPAAPVARVWWWEFVM
jgi:hypothetical protein